MVAHARMIPALLAALYLKVLRAAAAGSPYSTGMVLERWTPRAVLRVEGLVRMWYMV